MTIKWKSLILASASFVFLAGGAARADCVYFLDGTNGNDYLKAPNNGCCWNILGYGGNDILIGNLAAYNELFPGTNNGPPGDTMTGGDPTGPRAARFAKDDSPPAQNCRVESPRSKKLH